MSGNCIPISHGNHSRECLAKYLLLGKITLTSDMTEMQIFNEISSVFKNSFGGHENFKFLILQSTANHRKSVTNISGWEAVFLKIAKIPIYILAQEPLKVCFV